MKNKEVQSHAMLVGGFSPYTKAHHENVKQMLGGDHASVNVFATQSSRRPISAEKKVDYIKTAAGEGVNVNTTLTPFHAAAKLHAEGKRGKLVLYGGSDRAPIADRLREYNGKEGKHGYYNFEGGIEFRQVGGERKEGAKGLAGISGTAARKAKNPQELKKFIPKELHSRAEEIFNDMNESTNPLAIFLLGSPGSGKDYVLNNIFSRFDLTEVQIDHMLNGAAEELINEGQNIVINGAIDEDKIAKVYDLLEGYSIDTVYVSVTNKVSKLRNSLRDNPLAENKRIEKFLRAEKLAESLDIKFVFNNSINLNESSELEKVFFASQIEKLLGRLVEHGLQMKEEPEPQTFKLIREKKFPPVKRKYGMPAKYSSGLSKSTALARKRHWEKANKLSDSDPEAYKPAPGDATAKTKPSKHTLAVRKMMGEEIVTEGKADKSLAAKAAKSGISLATLRKVYRRGVAAWNSGHRPGTTPSQWGHARVNSYINKGKTYHTADKDLREETEELNELKAQTYTDYISATYGDSPAAQARKFGGPKNPQRNLGRYRAKILRQKQINKPEYQQKLAQMRRDHDALHGRTVDPADRGYGQGRYMGDSVQVKGKVLPEETKIAGTNCKNCIWWVKESEKSVDKSELNENGGLKAPNEAYIKMSKHVDLVTLPGKATVKTKAYCGHDEIHDFVTERMCCAYWDGKGVKREFKGVADVMEDADINTLFEMQLMGTDEYRQHAIAMTPGQNQEIEDVTKSFGMDVSEEDCDCSGGDYTPGDCDCIEEETSIGSNPKNFREFRSQFKEAKEVELPPTADVTPTLKKVKPSNKISAPGRSYRGTMDGLPVTSRMTGEAVAFEKSTGAALKTGTKAVGKAIGKASPFVAIPLAAAEVEDKLKKKDYTGAAIAGASGAASLAPGLGTAASIGLDIIGTARDMAKEKKKLQKEANDPGVDKLKTNLSGAAIKGKANYILRKGLKFGGTIGALSAAPGIYNLTKNELPLPATTSVPGEMLNKLLTKWRKTPDMPDPLGEEVQKTINYHLTEGISFTENAFRPGSDMFFNMIDVAKELYKEGQYKPADEWEADMLKSDIGEKAIYEGQEVILDYPFEEELNEEDKTNGKGIGKPWREGGGGAVYVRDGDSIRKIRFSQSGMAKKYNDPARVRSFVARHRCLTNKDKTSASYWACRWPRFFSNSGKIWW